MPAESTLVWPERGAILRRHRRWFQRRCENRAQVDADRGGVFGSEAQVHVEDAQEASDQQAGAHLAGAGERDFGNDEGVAKPVAAFAPCGTARALFKSVMKC
jgi:hypothetical protein